VAKAKAAPAAGGERSPSRSFGVWSFASPRFLEAKAVPGSKKLVQLRVSLGAEERTIVAGILLDYLRRSSRASRSVIVANLKASKLMGVESRGMLLAAAGADGKLALVTPERAAEVGSKVKMIRDRTAVAATSADTRGKGS